MATLTIELPEGWEHIEHIVLVAPDEFNPAYKYVTVLEVDGEQTRVVEEVGSGPLNGNMIFAARVIRTGTAVVKR